MVVYVFQTSYAELQRFEHDSRDLLLAPATSKGVDNLLDHHTDGCHGSVFGARGTMSRASKVTFSNCPSQKRMQDGVLLHVTNAWPPCSEIVVATSGCTCNKICTSSDGATHVRIGCLGYWLN